MHVVCAGWDSPSSSVEMEQPYQAVTRHVGSLQTLEEVEASLVFFEDM